MNILIVDDSEICRNMMIKIFKNNSFIDVILVAKDGLEAIKQITLNKDVIDIVLIDNEMPILNGAHTVRHLREVYFNKIIIGITSSSGNILNEFINSGVDYIFSKPFDKNKMNTVMEFLSNYGFSRIKHKRIIMDEKGKLKWTDYHESLYKEHHTHHDSKEHHTHHESYKEHHSSKRDSI